MVSDKAMAAILLSLNKLENLAYLKNTNPMPILFVCLS